MSLQHILLGLLDEPAAGYDIKKSFDSQFKHFWAAELSQIYPTLSRLEERGLARSRLVPSGKGPPRRVYQRTAKGTRKLKKWLASGPTLSEERRHYLAQMYFMHELGDRAGAVAFLEKLRSAMSERLAILNEIEAEWRACDSRYPDALPDNEIFKQMTLQLGQRIFAANVEWCEECLARLSRPTDKKGAVG